MLIRVISLGAGVQSSTMALMAAAGEITPMPDCAIFADTGWEPAAVYKHLDWLETVLPFPVRRVSNGDIRTGILERRNTTGGRFAAIPWHTTNPDGSAGMGRRQCSSEYKLTPIMREIRSLLGVDRRASIAAGTVEVWLGISLDEAHRMRDARQAYMVNRYPLIEAGMTRRECLRWLTDHEFPTPAKSACVGCPYHSDDYWREMRDTRPMEWADAVAMDTALRQDKARGINAEEFMHRSRVPLHLADLSTWSERGQPDLFGNECEGMCGV